MTTSPASNMGRNIGIGVAVLLVLAVGGYFALNSAGISVVQVKTVTLTTVTSSTTQTSTSVSYNIVNGNIGVSSSSYSDYPVTAPAGAYNVQISGNFRASGGSGNDIIVLILDQTGFVNWQNGHQATNYYNSGQLTTSSFSVTLPSSGTYHLVYSNQLSTFTSKTVNTLTYTQPVQSVVTYTTTIVTTTK
jgi:hypothetical protein